MAFHVKFKVPKVLKSVKYSLAAVNGVFMLTGFLLLFVGIAVLVIFSEYNELITKRFSNVAGFVVATAVIILLGSGLGFYSAISQQFYFVAGSILQYVVLLLVTLIFEISMMITAFKLSNDAATEIRTPMLQSLQLYNNRLDITKMWDDLQMGFECCGVAGRFDWVSSQIPITCCHIDYGTISPFECNTNNAYTVGCASALGEWLAYNASVIAITALVTSCLQVLLSIMGGYLAYRSKFEVVELES
ncbi:leukocyte surface antigen CD53-like isoform X2 [Helicoverpa zea]|uniref:leukocyte surface antigen CD53-like isoform X2 n=1 Tax=Helicoverpa zea TaxID=7113 RepID=UPI001F5AB892|nr:leukocyte surface antigen CD53-like isoform X2 [Helicoverpa zea]